GHAGHHWSRNRQDVVKISPHPKVYSIGEQGPDGRMARACARMRTGSSGAMPCLTICYQGEAAMYKLFIGSLVLCLLGQGTSSVGEQPPAPRGELRIVDKSPLNWVWIALNVFEHLVELDKDGQLVPGLATGWRWLDDRTLEVTLRQGVTFHNGEVFDAEI